MMSGSNPFRHRRATDGDTAPASALTHPTLPISDEIARAGQRFPPLTVETTTPRPSPKPKTVRIASPPVPISPETPLISASPTPNTSPVFPRRTQPLGSPYPGADNDSASSDDGSPDDPFNAEASDGDDDHEDEEVALNTRKNLRILANSPDSMKGSKQVEVDPVKATLAKFASGPRRRPDGKPVTSHSSKPSMDVDAFKRLLLTGTSSLPPNTTSNLPASLSQGPPSQPGGISDSSSSTDTASVSRQSIFEPLPTVQADTPRTSHEISMSDDERARLVGDGSDAKKPPPPKARHGKLIKNNPPNSSNAAPSSPSEPAFSRYPLPSPKSNLTDLDVNKPLPQPPKEPDPFIPRGPSRTETEPLSLTQRDPSPPTQPKKQRPPTPPLTRRHSERKPNSKSNPRLSLDPYSLTSPTDNKLQGLGLKTPPPPPSRRPLESRQSYSSGSPSPPSSLKSPSYEFPTTTKPESTTFLPLPNLPTNPPAIIKPPSKPPLPPARTPSSASIKRLSRFASHTRDPSTSAISSMQPPPPPPPRRSRAPSISSFDSSSRVSVPPSRGSMDVRRPSADTATEGSRNMSGASLASNENGRTGSGADIMKDLERLQKELDAYRGQVEGVPGGGGSAAGEGGGN